ncbi:hypothetical protein [Arabidopsis thaliana]|uniref:Uncharacterized protein AT4g24600 n=2 Tax=Arabidopsis TaxID=3701 RepID=Q9SB55_ARATH|nr:uncharacterized protein AT4G24600 [Arabidopsis thaliana]AEE84930.1 hypothetical protein AT4G24600 [Arabidopsis thaliana]CAA23003.1 hypothetical protein [Arabidopsis thaliana]CAB79370.1 hypothetical protein [Arabidopsis thaliana]|eukprot:NP_194191.1 hypothetical protein AT4G24600 [Arabidopsis thaliana]
MEKDPDFAVSLLWDGENTPVEVDQVDNLINNIEASVRTADPRYHLAQRKVLVGHENLDFIKENEKSLQVQGFRLIKPPYRERKCVICDGSVQTSRHKRYPYERPYDVADRLILQELLVQKLLCF